MEDDLKSYQSLLLAYRSRRDGYMHIAERYAGTVQELASRAGMKPLVTFRAKTVESLASKFMCKYSAVCDEPADVLLTRFSDLAGVRAIVHTVKDVDRLVAACRLHFDVDEENSVDKDAQAEVTSFGYRSKHLVLNVAAGEVPLPVPSPVRVELQIRTFAQHVWAELYHDIGYKSEFSIPENWTRDFARISAMLEECDKGFQGICDELQCIESHLDQYLDTNKLAPLARKLEVLHQVEPDNLRVVHRLVRVYNALGLHGRAAQLEPSLAGRTDARPALKRDLGFGITRLANKSPLSPEFRRGQDLVRGAVEEDPGDVDALSTLAGTYRKQGDRSLARHFYHRAHTVDPGFSYALANFLLEELLEQNDFAIVEHFSAGISHARARCLRQVEAGINMPWVYFDLAFYELLQGATVPSLNLYARGAAAASADWMIETTIGSLSDLLKRQPGHTGLHSAILTLGLVLAARFPGKAVPAALMSSPSPRELLTVRPILILAGSGRAVDPGTTAWMEHLFEALNTFQGTIVSGGTDAGVSGIAGRLQEQSGDRALFTLGYLPGLRSAEQDMRYSEHVPTSGTEYSFLEPLTYWADLLYAGRRGWEVRLIGLGGGDISSFEYRLALTMGARVGLVRGSGREADKLLDDPMWTQFKSDKSADPGRLLALDKSILAMFLD